MIATRPPFLRTDKYADLIRSSPSLVGYWRMRHQSGTVLVDELGLANGSHATSGVAGRATPITDGASVQFNGTNTWAVITKNLSSYALLSLSCWLWWDSFSGNDDLAFEYGPTYTSVAGFLIDPNASNNAGAFFNFGLGGVGSWIDQFTRPTAAAWHHYLFTMDRTNKVLAAYVDGIPQALTTVVHQAGTYGNFGNSSLYVMCRNTASLFGAGRMSELAIFGGVILGQNEAAMQYNVGIGR